MTTSGGTYIPLRDSDQQIDDLLKLTHIITTHIDFPQYGSAIEHGVSVVRPSWIFQSVKKEKQVHTRQHTPDPSQYFRDVVITSAELPEGDKDAIVAGVIALGGMYSGPLTKLVTHIVTTDYDHDKCKLAQQKNVRCKIVLPHWFDDCFKLGKLIDEQPYSFPNPELLQRISTAPRQVDTPHLQGATSAKPTTSIASLEYTPPSSPSESRKNLNAFMGRKVKLSDDLDINDHLVQTIETLINHGGGTLTDDIEQADIYIGHYRDGTDYVKASKSDKEVANLSWLYHVINKNKYTNPRNKLLHYPVPRNGLPGFENMKISISNYTGDARIYLENLITYCGAEFTKTMKQDNTHLITAHNKSEKCDAAQEWGINIINHLWLEEGYAKCCVQSLTVPRYTLFPPRTNLSEVVGQTMFDMKRVEQTFYLKTRESPRKRPQSPGAQTKSKPSPRKTVPVSSVGGPRSSLTPRGNIQTGVPPPDGEDAETDGEPEAEPQTTKKAVCRPAKAAATPRLGEYEKENESPLARSSGRASKARALDAMHGQASDIALFQREMKRKGGVTHGGRRSDHTEEVASPAPAPKNKKKRTSDEATYDVTAQGSDLSDGETQEKPSKATKKAKHAAAPAELPPVRYKMMVTGDERWLGKPKQEDADRSKLRLLGVLVTQDVNEVDILVAPNIRRTRKFVAALASAPLVVDTKYLDTALKQHKLLDNPSQLRDPDGEKQFGFKLADALERAKANKRELLDGWHIYVTKDITGGFGTYKDIVSVNGGWAYPYQGRTGLTIPKRRLRDDADNSGEQEDADGPFDYVYLVSGIAEPEVKLWKPFRVLVEKQGLRTRVVKSDWLLNAAMCQEIQWDEKWELDEEKVLSQRKG